MTDSAAINARLDQRERDNEGYPCDIDDLVGALRAVLDDLDDEDLRPGGNKTIPTDCIREVMAEALGLVGIEDA